MQVVQPPPTACLPGLQLPDLEEANGALVLTALLDWGAAAVGQLHASPAAAAVGRIRGTGPGASIGRLIARLHGDCPISIEAPFEGSARVAGGVWDTRAWTGIARADALVRLEFAAGALDLPMHAHPESDRLLLVIGGRGYFHVTPQPLEGFDGTRVRTIPVRDRDAVLFRGGVVHTFSADSEPLTLLSYHAPFIPLESTRQYALPAARWTASQHLHRTQGCVALDPAWSVLA